MNKNTQSLILSELFFQKIKRLEKNEKGVYPGTPSYKYAILENAYQCLDSGHSFEFLKEAMLNAVIKNEEYYNIEEFMQKTFGDFEVTKEPMVTQDNLIHPGRFYLHPLLQETSKKPSYQINMETMNIEKVEAEPFYLEIKERFSVQEVLNYYYMTHQKEPVPGKSHTTQMMNLLTDFGLDKVLYLIDASAQDFKDESGGARVPAFLTEYIEESNDLLNKRKSLLKEGGLTRVYPREEYLIGIKTE